MGGKEIQIVLLKPKKFQKYKIMIFTIFYDVCMDILIFHSPTRSVIAQSTRAG